MKLFAFLTSERGKELQKSGNDFIDVKLTCNKRTHAIITIDQQGYILVKDANNKPVANFVALIGGKLEQL